MTYRERMEQKLRRGLSPVSLEIEDNSHKHAGHGGAHPQGETHFRVTVIATAFEGLSRIDRQRKVYGLLAAELAERVHALELVLKTPSE